MNRSLRSRLLIGIGTLMVTGFAVVSIVIFVLLRESLVSEFDALLGSKVHALAALVEQRDEDIKLHFVDHPLPEFARKLRPEYYQVWNEEGEVLARSRRLGMGNLRQLSGALAAPGYTSEDLPDGRPGRLVAIEFFPAVEGESLERPIGSGDIDLDDDSIDRVDFTNRRRVTLVVARDTVEMDQAIKGLAWLLAGVFVGVTIASLGIVAVLLRWSLQPLDQLAKQIADLDERGLDYRFSIADLPSELSPILTRLNGLLGRLEEAFYRERAMTADVAHELRTPLAGLRATLEVTLSRIRDRDEYERALKACEAICVDTQRVVESLLSLARIDSNQIDSQRSKVEVAVLVTSVWESYHERAKDRKLTISFDGPRGLTLQTDPAQLHIVLANLFDNAVEYCDSGGNIAISWRSDSDSVQITVANTGCQLNEDQMPKIFDRFWRADNARGGTGAHAGLGLAMCQRIVELLGGSIEAVNDRGEFVVIICFKGNPEQQELPAEIAAATDLYESIGTR